MLQGTTALRDKLWQLQPRLSVLLVSIALEGLQLLSHAPMPPIKIFLGKFLAGTVLSDPIATTMPRCPSFVLKATIVLKPLRTLFFAPMARMLYLGTRASLCQHSAANVLPKSIAMPASFKGTVWPDTFASPDRQCRIHNRKILQRWGEFVPVVSTVRWGQRTPSLAPTTPSIPILALNRCPSACRVLRATLVMLEIQSPLPVPPASTASLNSLPRIVCLAHTIPQLLAPTRQRVCPVSLATTARTLPWSPSLTILVPLGGIVPVPVASQSRVLVDLSDRLSWEPLSRIVPNVPWDSSVRMAPLLPPSALRVLSVNQAPLLPLIVRVGVSALLDLVLHNPVLLARTAQTPLGRPLCALREATVLRTRTSPSCAHWVTLGLRAFPCGTRKRIRVLHVLQDTLVYRTTALGVLFARLDMYACLVLPPPPPPTMPPSVDTFALEAFTVRRGLVWRSPVPQALLAPPLASQLRMSAHRVHLEPTTSLLGRQGAFPVVHQPLLHLMRPFAAVWARTVVSSHQMGRAHVFLDSLGLTSPKW